MKVLWGERRPARGKYPSPCLPSAAQFCLQAPELAAAVGAILQRRACPAAVISSSILQAPESRPGIWPLHCVSQASAMISWVVFLGRFLSHSFWEIGPNWDARLLRRYRVCGRHQPALEHEGKADKIGMALIAGSLQCSCKHKGCSCETPRIEGVLFFVRLTNVNLKSGQTFGFKIRGFWIQNLSWIYW